MPMLQWSSVFYFLIRHFKNNLLFFSGSLMIVCLQYLFFLTHREIFFLPKNHLWLWIFIILIAIQMVYQMVFYLKNSRRIGLLLLYGTGKAGIFFIAFLENLMILALAILINLLAGEIPDLISILLFLALSLACAGVSVARYLFSDLYQILKE